MVLKANDRRICPCHDEFRGPRSDYVRQDYGLPVTLPQDSWGVIPVHAVRASTPSHRERRSSKSRNSHRLSYKVSSMASDGHSGDESENETTYIFNREVPASYLDTHEMSEAECDRDLHEFCEKNEKFQIFEQYDGQRICIT
ncbi:uncharacterized protein TNCV_3811082 [Trichonephila clavipes]|nr:uncharacterized protein TNCV_3811082 [Trichonephila clavipes]